MTIYPRPIYSERFAFTAPTLMTEVTVHFDMMREYIDLYTEEEITEVGRSALRNWAERTRVSVMLDRGKLVRL